MFLEKDPKNKVVSIPFLCAAGTDTGRGRMKNEDVFVFDAEHGFFLVVDGMGGHENGEIAAQTAAEIIQTGIRKIENSASIRLFDSIILANNAVAEKNKIESSAMGCVLTALLIENNKAYIGHVGDSRLYKIHRGELRKLTTDHSVVGAIEPDGRLSEQQLLNHPQRNEVTKCVGLEEKSFEDIDFIEIIETEIENDSGFLICSDGLSDLLTSGQILAVIEDNSADSRIIVEKLIARANELGGKDNITVVFIAGRDFAGEVFSRRNAVTDSKARGLFFNRWTFLLYGFLTGVLTLYLFYLQFSGNNLQVPAP